MAFPEAVFQFQGHARWSLGLPTPNYGGAAAALLLPALWAMGRAGFGRRGLGLILLAEEAGWFALAKTYSRGSLVAALAALGCWLAMERRIRPFTRAETLRRGSALAVAFILFAATSFLARAAPGFVRSDPSVGHRLALWQGGLRMLAASPLHGWGAGDAGFAYMNWFQPPGVPRPNSSLVNGWLQLAVERGAPACAAGAAALLLPVWLAALACRPAADAAGERASRIGAAGAASVAAWGAANGFSVLWDSAVLWAMAAAGAAAALAASPRPNALLRPAILAILTAAALNLGLIAAGLGLARGCPLECRPAGRRQAVFFRHPSAAGTAWYLMPDTRVLGPAPGMEARRLLLAAPAGGPSWVDLSYDPGPVRPPAPGCILVVFGGEWERLDPSVLTAGWSAFVWIGPSGPEDRAPPLQWPAAPGLRRTLLLPEIDQEGTNGAWAEEGRRAGFDVEFSHGTGTDLRLDWPRLLRAGGRA
ncbi:MAG TPA: O-antigen ligase family protein [Opitutaceae bacterium]|nr:O-antigen ligase family protein [Opitutaceae bacterium]